MDLLLEKYVEWIEDLGISPEQILIVLLEKEKEKVVDLKKQNSQLRNRLEKYEN